MRHAAGRAARRRGAQGGRAHGRAALRDRLPRRHLRQRSRRFAADDTARWIRRCANEVAFFFETCTLLYPQAASGAAPTAAGLPVEPLLRKWGRVMDGSEDHGLTPTDCFFVVSPSTFEELVALRRLYRAAMAARALVVVVNHGFEAPPPELDEASEVYRLSPLDIEEPSTGKVARVCVSRRFPTDYEVLLHGDPSTRRRAAVCSNKNRTTPSCGPWQGADE